MWPLRKIGFGVFAVLGFHLLSAGIARADDASTQAKRFAYDASIRCFEANGLARSDAVQLDKRDLAAAFERKAKASHDAAFKLGGLLGYNEREIQQDIDAAATSELPKLVRDPAYFRSVSATCKALELM